MQGHYSNHFHRQKVGDCYEDEGCEYDDYEEEASEQEEVETQLPTKDEKEFLTLRERLREQARRKLREETAVAFGHKFQSGSRKQSAAKDNKFGTFFGPSKPVVAPRVIEEARAVRETQYTVSSYHTSGKLKSDPSSSMAISNGHPQEKKFVSESKRKAESLKSSRDYSFLFSNDVDIPSPSMQQAGIRNPSVSEKTDIQSSGKTSRNSLLPSDRPAGVASNDYFFQQLVRENGGIAKRVPSNKGAMVPAESRKMLNGVMRSTAIQSIPGKAEKITSNMLPASRHTALNKSVTRRAPSSAIRTVAANKPSVKTDAATKRGSGPILKDPTRSLKSHSVENYRPGLKRVEGQIPKQGVEGQRPKQGVEGQRPKQRMDSQRPNLAERQQMAPLRSQIIKPSSSLASRDAHLKRKPSRPFDDDEDADAIGMIRQMFRYDPRRYSRDDDDDSDMEVGFDTIQKEERRSSKIARQEDEEQLRLIEEEERRQSMRKKKKLSHNR